MTYLENGIMKNRAIGIISLKGGVGKTTVSSNLAYLLAKKFNHKTLALDSNLSAPGLGIHFGIIDPHKQRTTHSIIKDSKYIPYAIHPYEHLHIIPAALNNEQVDASKLPYVINELKKQYHAVILDSSPAYTDDFIHSLKCCDGVVLVTTPDYNSLANVLQTIKLTEELKTHILGIIVNKKTGKSHELTNAHIRQITGKPVIGTVRSDKNISIALSKTMPISKFKPKSKSSKDLLKIAETLSKIN
jgi:MinD-like ATPase involved in chromosome partitioning or flagellar assembly